MRTSTILFSLLAAALLFVIAPASAQAPTFTSPISTPADLDVGTISSDATDVTIVD